MVQTKKKIMSLADELIAVRAYERWMGRGCPVSDGTEDGLAARSELESELYQKPQRSAARRVTVKTLRA